MKVEKKIEQELQELKQLLTIQNDEPLSIDEACKFTGYKKSYLYKLTCLKQIPFYKPNDKKIFFSKNELRNWIFRNRQDSTQEIDEQAEAYINKNIQLNS